MSIHNHTILLTGASGFLGRHFQRWFTRRGWDVYGFGRAAADAQYGSRWLQGDILSRESLEKALEHSQASVMIHCAAVSQPAACMRNPEESRIVNVRGTAMALAASIEARVPFISFSSDLVFDGEKGQYSETSEPSPNNEYGRQKADVEMFLAAQQYTHEWALLRLSLVAGPPHSSSRESFPSFAISRILANEPLSLFTDQYRTPVLVDDVADAVERIISYSAWGSIYNCAGDTRYSRADYIRTFCEVNGLHYPGPSVECSMNDIGSYHTLVADVGLVNGRLRNVTGWRPTPAELAMKSIWQNWNKE